MLEAGATVGRYRLVEQLDSRAGGERFRALDAQGDRPVTLIAPPAARFASPDAVQAFATNARRIATLEHPNLVRVLDVLIHQDRPLVVSEWVDGVTLDDALGGRRLPTADALRVARDVARALAYLHGQRLGHGRLTASSVLVDRRSGAARVWDLALLGDPAAPMSADLKSLGDLLATMLTGQAAPGASAAALPEPVARLLERLASPSSGLSAAEVVEALDPARLTGRARQATIRAPGSAARWAASGGLWRDPRVLGGAAVVLILLVAVGTWLSRGPPVDETPAVEEAAPIDTEKPVVAEPEEPAEPSPPTIDRAAIEQAAFPFVLATPCSDLELAVAEDGVLTVEGLVPTAETGAALQEQLATIPGVVRVQSAITVRPVPHCLAAETMLARAAATVDPPELRLNRSDGVYRLGEYFVAEIRMPPALSGSLYVDLFTQDGQVTHLLPEPLRAVNVLAAGEAIRIGVEEQDRQEGVRDWRVDPPVGDAWLVVTAAERPLYEGLLPITQPASAYLDRVVAALDGGAAGERSVRIQRLEFRED